MRNKPWLIALMTFGFLLIMIAPSRPIPFYSIFAGLSFLLITVLIEFVMKKRG